MGENMEKKLTITIMLLLILGMVCVSNCIASSGNAGTRSAQFLKMGFGGRPVSMGGAFVGLADDINAVYWNPAGLAQIHRPQLCFMHLVWFCDISYEYFAYAKPYAKPSEKLGVFGLSIGYLHMGKIEGRDEEGNQTSPYTASDIVITFSHGSKITKNLFLGGNIKHLIEKIERESANAFAFDVGFLYKTPLKNLSLGGTLQNFGQPIKFVAESCKLPTTAKLGACYSYIFMGSPMNFAMDIYFPSDGKTSLHLGTEGIYKNTLSGRIGYENNSDLVNSSSLSFGLGLMLTKNQTYALDYAFVPQGVLGNTHTFSFGVKF
jgi:hypothetical protein